MYRITIIIMASSMWVLPFYLITSFISLDFNIFNWGEFARSAFSILSFLFIALMVNGSKGVSRE